MYFILYFKGNGPILDVNVKRRKNCFPVQVDSQQFDVSYPTVFYPTPIPPRVTKRTGKHI